MLAGRSISRLRWALGLIAISLWLQTPAVFANADIERAIPAPDATLHKTPRQIAVTDLAPLKDLRRAFPVVVRWATLLVAFLLAGIVAFRVCVMRPSLEALVDHGARERGEAAESRLRYLTIDSAMALMILVAVQAALLSAGLLEGSGSYVQAGRVFWRFLIGTSQGWGVLIRGGLAFIVLLAECRRRPLVWVSAFAAALMLSGFTLTSHAARTSSLAVVADWTHLLAASIWVGGLLSLLVVLQGTAQADRPQIAHVVVPRFSTLAGASLIALILTGLFLTWLFVADASTFIQSAYGRKLLTKFLFVAVMAGLGIINRFLFVPQLRVKATYPLAQGLLRLVKVEVALGVLVLLVVAIPAIAPSERVAEPERAHPAIRAEAGFSNLAPDRVRVPGSR